MASYNADFDMASKMSELRADIDELNRFMELTSRSSVKDALSLQVKRLQTELSILVANSDLSNGKEAGASFEKSHVSSGESSVKKVYDKKITTYAWDQSDSFVKIFVTMPKIEELDPNNITCEFSERHFVLVVKEFGGFNHILTINNLLEAIDTQKSNWKVKKGMLVVYLSKTSSEKWAFLTKAEKVASDARAPKLPKGEDSADPSKGILDLMKQMYESGDDDMKRTIAQAWCESQEKKKVNFDM